MANKINVKLILELRDAGMSRNGIASTRHMLRSSPVRKRRSLRNMPRFLSLFLMNGSWQIYLLKNSIFAFELTERRSDTTSTIFCTQYSKKDWIKKLGEGVYAEAIVDRYAYNTVWI